MKLILLIYETYNLKTERQVNCCNSVFKPFGGMIETEQIPNLFFVLFEQKSFIMKMLDLNDEYKHGIHFN